MRQALSKSLLSALILTFVCVQSYAASTKANPSDPNAELKKLQGPPKPPAGPPEIPGAKALANLQADQKRNNEVGVMHFTKLIQADPKDSASYAGRGKAYSGLRDYEKATADFNKAIELDPKQVEAYKGRAVVKYTKNDFEGSWDDVRKVESLGEAMWPSFMEALKASSNRKS